MRGLANADATGRERQRVSYTADGQHSLTSLVSTHPSTNPKLHCNENNGNASPMFVASVISPMLALIALPDPESAPLRPRAKTSIQKDDPSPKRAVEEATPRRPGRQATKGDRSQRRLSVRIGDVLTGHYNRLPSPVVAQVPPRVNGEDLGGREGSFNAASPPR